MCLLGFCRKSKTCSDGDESCVDALIQDELFQSFIRLVICRYGLYFFWDWVLKEPSEDWFIQSGTSFKGIHFLIWNQRNWKIVKWDFYSVCKSAFSSVVRTHSHCAIIQLCSTSIICWRCPPLRVFTRYQSVAPYWWTDTLLSKLWELPSLTGKISVHFLLDKLPTRFWHKITGRFLSDFNMLIKVGVEE